MSQCNVPMDLGPVSAISSGGYHTAALQSDGKVRCWGFNIYNQCVVPANLGPVIAVAAGGYFQRCSPIQRKRPLLGMELLR
jgi:alpha-tubulin suppressor-like RCC1 family protein